MVFKLIYRLLGVCRKNINRSLFKAEKNDESVSFAKIQVACDRTFTLLFAHKKAGSQADPAQGRMAPLRAPVRFI
jgi:hypothetical protein